jgi:hypothetical protein
MPEIKSHRQIWGEDFPVGSEWDAGATPPLWPTYPSGRWTIRREDNRFIVLSIALGTGKKLSSKSSRLTNKAK